MSDSDSLTHLDSLSDVKRRAVIFLWKAFLLGKRMGGFLDKPKTEKVREHGQGNGLKYGVASMQGWRLEMEDAHSVRTGLTDNFKDWSFFAVFDGHCGSNVSAYCAQHLLQTIVQTEDFKKLSTSGEETNEDTAAIMKAIRAGFLKLDEEMRQLPTISSGDDKSGSTAVCAIVSPTHIYIANCGDSRAVLCRKGAAAVATEDHKPTNPLERDRIQRAGGSVMIHRVNGSLAVSRSLGDFEYKNVEGKGPTEQLVSPEPEILVEERKEEDEFLILACDGIWDVTSNDGLCELITKQLAITEDLGQVAASVVDNCLFKGSRDNMSIVLVTFSSAPKLSPELVAKNKAIEEKVKERTLEILKGDEHVEIGRVLQLLSEEEIRDVELIGGIGTKRSFIESVLAGQKPSSLDEGN